MLSVAQSNGIGRHRVSEVLRLTGLEAVAGRRVKGCSLGMKQRLGLAAALLGDPPILMFDEPVNGLDTEGIHWIRQFFKALAGEGRTVLVSSHLMTEMALTADHLIVIGRGRLLADTPTGQLIDSSARQDVLLRSPRAAELAGLLAARGATVTPQPDGALVVTGLDAAAIGDLAAQHGLALHALVPRQASLEDVYLDLDWRKHRLPGPGRMIDVLRSEWTSSVRFARPTGRSWSPWSRPSGSVPSSPTPWPARPAPGRRSTRCCPACSAWSTPCSRSASWAC